jgi:hypothetical protein
MVVRYLSKEEVVAELDAEGEEDGTKSGDNADERAKEQPVSVPRDSKDASEGTNALNKLQKYTSTKRLTTKGRARNRRVPFHERGEGVAGCDAVTSKGRPFIPYYYNALRQELQVRTLSVLRLIAVGEATLAEVNAEWKDRGKDYDSLQKAIRWR